MLIIYAGKRVHFHVVERKRRLDSAIGRSPQSHVDRALAGDRAAVAAHDEFAAGDIETAEAERRRGAVVREREKLPVSRREQPVIGVSARPRRQSARAALRDINRHRTCSALDERSAFRREIIDGYIGSVIDHDRPLRIGRSQSKREGRQAAARRYLQSSVAEADLRAADRAVAGERHFAALQRDIAAEEIIARENHPARAGLAEAGGAHASRERDLCSRRRVKRERGAGHDRHVEAVRSGENIDKRTAVSAKNYRTGPGEHPVAAVKLDRAGFRRRRDRHRRIAGIGEHRLRRRSRDAGRPRRHLFPAAAAAVPPRRSVHFRGVFHFHRPDGMTGSVGRETRNRQPAVRRLHPFQPQKFQLPFRLRRNRRFGRQEAGKLLLSRIRGKAHHQSVEFKRPAHPERVARIENERRVGERERIDRKRARRTFERKRRRRTDGDITLQNDSCIFIGGDKKRSRLDDRLGNIPLRRHVKRDRTGTALYEPSADARHVGNVLTDEMLIPAVIDDKPPLAGLAPVETGNEGLPDVILLLNAHRLDNAAVAGEMRPPALVGLLAFGTTAADSCLYGICAALQNITAGLGGIRKEHPVGLDPAAGLPYNVRLNGSGGHIRAVADVDLVVDLDRAAADLQNRPPAGVAADISPQRRGHIRISVHGQSSVARDLNSVAGIVQTGKPAIRKFRRPACDIELSIGVDDAVGRIKVTFDPFRDARAVTYRKIAVIVLTPDIERRIQRDHLLDGGIIVSVRITDMHRGAGARIFSERVPDGIFQPRDSVRRTIGVIGPLRRQRRTVQDAEFVSVQGTSVILAAVKRDIAGHRKFRAVDLDGDFTAIVSDFRIPVRGERSVDRVPATGKSKPVGLCVALEPHGRQRRGFIFKDDLAGRSGGSAQKEFAPRMRNSAGRIKIYRAAGEPGAKGIAGILRDGNSRFIPEKRAFNGRGRGRVGQREENAVFGTELERPRGIYAVRRQIGHQQRISAAVEHRPGARRYGKNDTAERRRRIAVEKQRVFARPRRRQQYLFTGKRRGIALPDVARRKTSASARPLRGGGPKSERERQHSTYDFKTVHSLRLSSYCSFS